ncbi:MAG: ATPase, T2SS/T4P/T4SS family [Actinomycetota bacterium]|nr:CpaF family protein [Ilumatobacteraceae bacterium]MDA3007192.1 ATPase, T2SS/T4P/T4SS family [Actinomycetota bacterium]MDA3034354.1 ATPase, T2SS/T4P/T4SS family [Actinomycetota bacterium]
MSTSDVATAWAETEAEDLTDDVLVRIDDQSSRGAADHGHHDLENTPDGQVDQVVLSGDDFVNIDGVSSSTKPSNRAQAAPGLIIDIADSVMTRLVDRGVSPRGAGAGFDASSVELHSLIIAAVDEADRVRVRQGQSPLPADVREHVESAVMAEIIGTGPLDPYLSDPDVEEIDVNSAACTWVTWCDGRKIDVGRLWPDDAALTQFQKRLARRMSATGEGRLDTASPTLTLQTRAGDRVVMVLGGESEHGLSPHPRLSIRRYVIRRTGLSGLVERGLMVPAAADFLSAAVRAGCTILISGPPGAGKTTLLTELLGEVDPDERIITVEKHLLELGLEVGGRHRDSVALHTRGANAEGLGEVGTRQLVELTRRLNPDRVVIGELVEDEALDMLDVASMCSRGSLATIHAHTAEAVIHRLAYYVAKAQTSLPEFAVWNLIAHTVDLVVHVDAITPRDSTRGQPLVPVRRVTSVIEIGPVGERGVPTMSDVLVWDAAHDALRAKSPLSSRLIDRIRSHSAANSSPRRRSSGGRSGR